jgi:uncharacterized protein DUF6325
MAMGPMELVVLSFPAERLYEGALAALHQLSTAGEMKIVDVLVVRVDSAGRPRAVELSEMPSLCGLARLTSGLITDVDVAEMSPLVDDSTVALAVLLEHRWVLDLERPVSASNGSIVALTHIPGAPAAVAH